MTPRIPPTTAETAHEATKPVFGQLKTALGMVPNLYATAGHSPGSLSSLLAWDAAVAKGPLSRREVELLNLHVSELNGCGYCLSAHTLLGRRSGLTVDEMDRGRAGTATNAREDALLALARRVVRTGGSGAGTELERARQAGLSDAEVVDALAVVAMKTFTNALAVLGQVEIDFPRAPRLPQG
jgi:uncharacterized peroxidase-related enzyme